MFFSEQRLHKCFARYHVLTWPWRLLAYINSTSGLPRKFSDHRPPLKSESIRTIVLRSRTFSIAHEGTCICTFRNNCSRTALQLRRHGIKHVVRRSWYSVCFRSIFFSDVVRWTVVGGPRSRVLVWTRTLSAV